MAREFPVFDRSRLATSDLSSSQFMAVTLDSNGKLVLPSSGAQIFGVLQNKPTAGLVGDVRVVGLTKMVAGATVTSGDIVMADGAGKCRTATSGNYQIGWCEDSATAGQTTTVTLVSMGKQ